MVVRFAFVESLTTFLRPQVDASKPTRSTSFAVPGPCWWCNLRVSWNFAESHELLTSESESESQPSRYTLENKHGTEIVDVWNFPFQMGHFQVPY